MGKKMKLPTVKPKPWIIVGYKPILFELFKYKIDALEDIQNIVVPSVKQRIKDLDARWKKEKKLSEENLYCFEEYLVEEYRQIDEMEKDFLLLTTVAINSELENLLKKIVGWTGKIKGNKYRRWNMGQLEVFYETIGAPIPHDKDIAIIRKICNRYKHNEALCDEELGKLGYGKKDEKIEITKEQVSFFFKKALEYAKGLIDNTPLK